MRSRTLVSILVIAAIAATYAAPADAQPSPRSEFEQASERLDLVTEEYNQAQLRRGALDSKLRAAEANLQRSEVKLAHTRKRFGRAVREMYMHPGSHLESFFGARDFGEYQRHSALAGRVAMSAEGLLLQIRKVKAEETAATRSLRAQRDDARRVELTIDGKRREAASALRRTRAMLADAQLATELAAERRSALSEASKLAAARITFAGPVRASAAKAVQTAAAQIGDPYQWGASGPDRFDCSGLTMYAWASAGVSLPHSSRAQYASLPHVPLSEIAPGDLLFSGSPNHHVGIYKGGGVMINAPHSGESVREDSIYSRHFVGAARP